MTLAGGTEQQLHLSDIHIRYGHSDALTGATCDLPPGSVAG